MSPAVAAPLDPRGHRRLERLLMALVIVAMGLRIAASDRRPVHADEAMNATIVGHMLLGQPYRYDPHDHHGPTLYYISYAWMRLRGIRGIADMDAVMLRIPAACAGAAAIFLLLLLRTELNTVEAAAAGLLIAGAAPMVYYGAYFIHETLVSSLALLIILALGKYYDDEKHRRGWIFVAGAALGALAATKETFSLIAVAAFAAWAVIAGIDWRRGLARTRPGVAAGLLLAAVVAISVALLFFTSAGHYPAGAKSMLAGIFRFVQRAKGEGHQKPWWTYLAWLTQTGRYRMAWTGVGIIALAAIGTVAALRRGAGALRFVGPFAFILAGFYTVIPYKTPWLMLDFLVPAAVVAGYGAGVLLRAAKATGRRAYFPTLLAVFILAGFMARDTCRLAFLCPSDDRNPLAYSPTVPDADNIAPAVEAVAARVPDGRNLLVQVIGTNYWPLPWCLRRFPNVGYWSEPPATLRGTVVIATMPLADAVTRKLGPGWSAQYFGLRPGFLLLLYSPARNAP